MKNHYQKVKKRMTDCNFAERTKTLLPTTETNSNKNTDKNQNIKVKQNIRTSIVYYNLGYKQRRANICDDKLNYITMVRET